MKKALALLLAFVLAFTVIPGKDAKAAELPKLNYSERIIYVGGSKVIKTGNYANDYYTLKVKNKTAKYSCSWSTDNEDVVDVEKLKGGKAKVTALKPGTATVTANFVDKTTNTRYTLNCKITVKKNCEAVGITGYNGSPIKVGTKIQLNGAMYDAAGKEVESGKDVTDVLRWVSVNDNIATVSDKGVVTATGAGTVDITCYAIQSETGTYSKYSKAVAKKSVTFTVEDPDIVGIAGVTMESLNSIKVELGSSALLPVTKDNFSITGAGGIPLDIKSVEATADEKVFRIITAGEFSDGASYTLVIKDTKATVKLMNTFTFQYGIPSRIEITTPISGNRVIAGKLTELKFRIYNAQGVDITPTDETSTAYYEMKNCVTFESSDSGYWFVSDDYVFIYEENRTVEIKARFSKSMLIAGAYVPISFDGRANVYSVNEATTVSFDPAVDLVLEDPEKAGSKMTFSGKPVTLPVNDDSGNYLIARVKDYSGKYIYSNDQGSPVIFEPETTQYCYVAANGKIIIADKGTDIVKILYNGKLIGRAAVTVIDARKASAVMFEVGGKFTESAVVSDAYGIGSSRVNIQVRDQYGELLKVKGYAEFSNFASNLSIEASGGPNAVAYAASDGTAYVNFDAAGYGSTAGQIYKYKVIYDDPLAGKAEGYFNLVVKTPQNTLPSTYSLKIEGNTDISLGASVNELPGLDLRMYEMKGGLVYSRIVPLYTSESVIYESNCFYRLYKEGSATEIKDAGCVQTDKINPVYVNSDGKLVKLEAGAYKVVVYKKNSTGFSTIAAGTFVLTDNDNAIKVQQIKKTTSEKLNKDSASDIGLMRAIFNECFKITKGNNEIPVIDVSFPDDVTTDNYGVYFNNVIINDTVTVGTKTYTIEHPIKIRTFIKSE
ncbi:MAG: hypothetical protein K6E62_14595 [Lachnospiraceae bacterium]|nr:hypothetical protein [Lachnospiraceae bacterium]